MEVKITLENFDEEVQEYEELTEDIYIGEKIRVGGLGDDEHIQRIFHG